MKNQTEIYGKLYLVSEECKKTEGTYFLIATPTKKNPSVSDSSRVSGFWLKKLSDTPFFRNNIHFEEELILVKSSMSKIYRKYLLKEILILPFYFFLRQKLANLENGENIWADQLDVSDEIEIINDNPEFSSNEQFTLRFALSANGEKISQLENIFSTKKKLSLNNEQEVFSTFISKYKSVESHNKEKLNFKMTLNEMILSLKELSNPVCMCTSKGFCPSDEIVTCECGRLYHVECIKKKNFDCNKCKLNEMGMISLSKRNDNEFQLDNIDFKSDLKKYKKENEKCPTERHIIRNRRERKKPQQKLKKKLASNCKSTPQHNQFINSVQEETRNLNATERLLNLDKNQNTFQKLNIEDKNLRIYEIWKFNYYNINTISHFDKQREIATGLIIKALCFSYLDLVQELEKLSRSNEDSSKASPFMKNIYTSKIFQLASKFNEKEIVEFLMNMTRKLEKEIYMKYFSVNYSNKQEYINFTKTFCLNLSQSHCQNLRYKIICKQLTYKQIADLPEEIFLSEDIQKQIQESKEEFWKEREVNKESTNYIIKNHKGDIEMVQNDDEDEFINRLDEQVFKSQQDYKKVEKDDYSMYIEEVLKTDEIIYFNVLKDNQTEFELKKIEDDNSNKKQEKQLKQMKDRDVSNGDSHTGNNSEPQKDKEISYIIDQIVEDNSNQIKQMNDKTDDAEEKKNKMTVKKLKCRLKKHAVKSLQPETLSTLKELVNNFN